MIRQSIVILQSLIFGMMTLFSWWSAEAGSPPKGGKIESGETRDYHFAIEERRQGQSPSGKPDPNVGVPPRPSSGPGIKRQGQSPGNKPALKPNRRNPRESGAGLPQGNGPRQGQSPGIE